MSYAAAVDHLNSLGLELAPGTRRKWDLAHMRTLADALGNPHLAFPSILVAGTNGKGSTAATLASILSAAGYRTALYTSPHLIRVNERIQIDGLDIDDEDFARLYFHVDETACRLVAEGRLPHPPSFFEILTAVAFSYFAEDRTSQRPVQIAVLEVGLGGRLDATNIVDPLLSILTDIALDHQEFLGTTIAEITREKAGILRPNGTLITLPQHPEANQAIGEAAATLNLTAISAASFIPALPPARFVPPVQRPTPIIQTQAQPPTPIIQTQAQPPAPIILSQAQPPTSVILSQAQPPTSVILSEGEAAAEGPASAPLPPLRSPSLSIRSAAEESASHPYPSPLTPNHYTLTLDGQTLEVDSPLPGHHQQRNLALAIAAAVTLRNQHGYNITNIAIEAGIRATRWPGRLDLLRFPEGPPLLLDVAHNPAGAWTLRAAIAQLPEDQPRTLIFSCLRDKPLAEISRILFPLFDSSPDADPARSSDHLILAPIANPRASSVEDLLAAAHALSIPAHAAPHLAGALAQARAVTPSNGIIIATGSVYLVGELRHLALHP